MRTDATLSFVPLGGNLSLVAAVGVDIPSTNVIDLLGEGVGTTVTNITGTATLAGQADGMGVGSIRPEINVTVGTALVADTGTPLLNVQLQAAADDGAGSPDTWQTIGESGDLTVAQCAANTVIARLPFLPPFPQNLRPRFLRLNFAIPTGTNFSAGTIASALVVPSRDDQFNRQAARNYTVA